MDGKKQETEFANHDWKVAGIVAFFGAGLVLSGVLRFYNLHAENPPQLTAYSTIIYIGFTVIAAVLLSRAGLPMKRLGFGPTFRPVKYLDLAGCYHPRLEQHNWYLWPVSGGLAGGGGTSSRSVAISG